MLLKATKSVSRIRVDFIQVLNSRLHTDYFWLSVLFLVFGVASYAVFGFITSRPPAFNNIIHNEHPENCKSSIKIDILKARTQDLALALHLKNPAGVSSTMSVATGFVEPASKPSTVKNVCCGYSRGTRQTV